MLIIVKTPFPALCKFNCIKRVYLKDSLSRSSESGCINCNLSSLKANNKTLESLSFMCV